MFLNFSSSFEDQNKLECLSMTNSFHTFEAKTLLSLLAVLHNVLNSRNLKHYSQIFKFWPGLGSNPGSLTDFYLHFAADLERPPHYMYILLQLTVYLC